MTTRRLPVGTPGALVAQRGWDDYSIGRADALEHLGALTTGNAKTEKAAAKRATKK